MLNKSFINLKNSKNCRVVYITNCSLEFVMAIKNPIEYDIPVYEIELAKAKLEYEIEITTLKNVECGTGNEFDRNGYK